MLSENSYMFCICFLQSVRCGDLEGWWCVPWDVSGTYINITWPLVYSPHATSLYILSVSRRSSTNYCDAPKFGNHLQSDYFRK